MHTPNRHIENSSESWNSIWKHIPSKFPGSETLEDWYRSIVYFPSFRKLLSSVPLSQKDILELGSGTGNNSLYFAKKYGVQSVTLVDFSDSALQRVREDKFPCNVTKLQKDLFTFQPPLQYGLVHSAGLIEHFFGSDRISVVKKHAECATQGGYVMIWVPVKSLIFSLIWQINKLQGIEEIPLTEQELRDLCTQSGLKIVKEAHAAGGAIYGVLAQKIENKPKAFIN